MNELAKYVYAIPDFPKPGIIFRDITGILQSADGFKLAIDQLADCLKGLDFDMIGGCESRGFFFSAPLADRFHKPVLPVRKAGKLPRKTVRQEYALEYGTAAIEINEDAVKPGDKVVLVDDLLATGGTMRATIDLVEKLGGKVVKVLFVIDLPALKGREKLAGYDVSCLLSFDGE